MLKVPKVMGLMLDTGYSITQDKHRAKLVIEDQETSIEHRVSDRILDKEIYWPLRATFPD